MINCCARLTAPCPDSTYHGVFAALGRLSPKIKHYISKTTKSAFDLDLWPTNLTKNPMLPKVKVDPLPKNQGQRSNGRALTDRRMDGQMLPNVLSIKSIKNVSKCNCWSTHTLIEVFRICDSSTLYNIEKIRNEKPSWFVWLNDPMLDCRHVARGFFITILLLICRPVLYKGFSDNL